jgi:AraC-like DNA-binding protein
MNAVAPLLRLRKLLPASGGPPQHWYHSTFDLQAGVEERREIDQYSWNGLHRGGNPMRPFAIVQYTLEGNGRFEQRDKAWTLREGSCFIAIVPSAHRYYLPEDSSSWTFLWMRTAHEYVVRRLAHICQRFSPVLHLPAESVPAMRLIGLFETISTTGFRDSLAVEQSLLDFTLEFERFAQASRFQAGQTVLDEVRRRVLARLRRPVAISELAQAAGMSASHYSHYFKAATGLSPLEHVTEIRLQEIARRLTLTHDTLKKIASDTGFADSNHLCKVFRRRFHTSPGRFRQLST